jgi:hypothetical protein
MTDKILFVAVLLFLGATIYLSVRIARESCALETAISKVAN